MRSLVAVLQVNPGFSSQGVLTMQLQITRASFPTEVAVGDYYHRLVARVKTIPGVAEAGIGGLPFSVFGSSGGVEFASKPNEKHLAARFHPATPGFLAALGIPLLRGRLFEPTDKAGAEHLAVISQSLARKHWPNEDPIGKRIQFGNMDGDLRLLSVVGVGGDVREQLHEEAQPTVYANSLQRPQPTAFAVVVHCRSSDSNCSQAWAFRR